MDRNQFDPLYPSAQEQPQITPPDEAPATPAAPPEETPPVPAAPAWPAFTAAPQGVSAPTSYEPEPQPAAEAAPMAPQTPVTPQPPAQPYPQAPVAQPVYPPHYPYGPSAGTPYYTSKPVRPAVSPPVNRRNRKGLKAFIAVLAAVVLLIGGLSTGYLIGQQGNRPAGQDGSASTPVVIPPQTEQTQDQPGNPSSFDVKTSARGDESYSYEQVVAAVAASVVNITVYSPTEDAGAYASGVIMDAKQGYVLTNDHIYADTPNAKFLITLNDGTEFHADFVSGDSRSDIAILKIQNPKGLQAATFSTDPLTVGERVLVIGQSYGYADSVAEGIVSSTNRRVSLSNGSYSETFIQTTAAVNPGNSGGALVNMQGQVVGIPSAKIITQEVEGLCFAIPAQRALDVVKNLQQNGKVVGRAKIGITYIELGTVLAERTNLPTGLRIEAIAEDSDLYGKGFHAGDVITHFNGQKILRSADVLDAIEQATAGDKVTLTIYQADTQKSRDVTITLAEAESTNSYKTGTARTETRDTASEDETPRYPYDPFEYFDEFFDREHNTP